MVAADGDWWCISGHRDVTTGATGATPVAPKFSDILTLFQPGHSGKMGVNYLAIWQKKIMQLRKSGNLLCQKSLES